MCIRDRYPIQCDFAAMISPQAFAEFVLPSLVEQCQRLDRTIYHLDGPGQINHLDYLLEIPELTGIQWTPGAGNPEVDSSCWFPLYKKIQAKGKRLVLLGVDKKRIEKLLKEISPEGLLITTLCESKEEGEQILEKVKKWSVKKIY